jgi:hypothetical protein
MMKISLITPTHFISEKWFQFCVKHGKALPLNSIAGAAVRLIPLKEEIKTWKNFGMRKDELAAKPLNSYTNYSETCS